MGACPGLELPRACGDREDQGALETTSCRRMASWAGHVLSKDKEQNSKYRPGIKNVSGSCGTSHGPLGKGSLFFLGLGFLLCETGMLVTISQDKMTRSLRIK